jgi:hypothetical protein
MITGEFGEFRSVLARWCMKCGIVTLGGLGVLAGLVVAGPACAQFRDRAAFSDSLRSRGMSSAKIPWNAPITIDALPVGVRDKVAKVVQSPTMTAHGPPEEFPGSFYEWLLDHPDRVALAWRRLGVPCVGIVPQGNGSFAWNDGQGSDLTWQCLFSGPSSRIWYAEGQSRLGAHLPLVSFRAVAVLRYAKRRESDGRTFVTHDVDIYVQTDSRAAALVLKLFGPAAPRLAEEGAAQLLLFFSGVSRHLEAFPEQTFTLLKS